MMEEVKIDKLAHGGQGIGTLKSGQKIFVWNALPGEIVKARIIKKKRSYGEAIAEEIVQPSSERIEPEEENYLATSPWQIMTLEAENKYKKVIVNELFMHEGVALPEFNDIAHVDQGWYYRNKMEYSFWGDDNGIHLALYKRGSHGKQIVSGSKLAMPAIDAAANKVVAQLNDVDVRAGEMKTIIVRCNQNGRAVASLFVKTKAFPNLTLPDELQGLRVYYSDPKSPASVPTKLLYKLGDVTLTDNLLNHEFTYDVDSFFQVNIPVFELALQSISQFCNESVLTDMYAGAGSIGLSVAKKQVTLVELDPATAAMARINAKKSPLDAKVVEASTEQALDYIQPNIPIVFDPPRAGLHRKVIEKVLDATPPKIIYLSCNPATQARDLAMLQGGYTIEHFEVFNFFPRTPHIETLAVLAKV